MHLESIELSAFRMFWNRLRATSDYFISKVSQKSYIMSVAMFVLQNDRQVSEL